MQPRLFGLPTYYLSWLVGTLLTTWLALRVARREGLPSGQLFVIVLLGCLSVIVGSKLLYLLEHWLFPLDDGLPIAQASMPNLAWHGFRIPGGMVLLALVLPLTCRALHLPIARVADTIIPAFGIGIGCARMGCFFNGCCVGRVSSLPWAVTFPPGGPIFDWQLVNGLLADHPTRTLPVQPLQIYFALLGVAVYGLGRRWQVQRRFAGEVWIKCYLLFFSGMFALEFLAQQFLHLNVAVSAAAMLAAGLAWITLGRDGIGTTLPGQLTPSTPPRPATG